MKRLAEPIKRRSAFSLLEVILALAVLSVSLAIIGEANSSADRNAYRAAAESDATLIAESVLAELVAGARGLAAVEATPWEVGANPPRWSFSISIEPASYGGLLTVFVTVEEIEPLGRAPVRVGLGRWVVDPAALPAALAVDSSSEPTTEPANGIVGGGL